MQSIESLCERIAEVAATNPGNRMAKHFSRDYLISLSPEDQERLIRIIRTGIENPDSSMGAYAMHPGDYDDFLPYLSKMIVDYHGISEDAVHVSSWDMQENVDLRDAYPELNDLSMRVRVARNLSAYPLPGAMSQEDRVNLENAMITVFEQLAQVPGYSGKYYSLTPGNPHQITQQQYQEFVTGHKMFKDMADDPYLAVAGISNDWPYGRGMFMTDDERFIIWVGEEDHLRVMAMLQGTRLNDVFTLLNQGLQTLEAQGVEFALSKNYGYVTSCPTNLGTGMRASVHIALPGLTAGGTDLSALKAVTDKLGLSVRGIGGEHTETGEGGVVDISPRARLCITEAEIIGKLYAGITQLLELEVQPQAA